MIVEPTGVVMKGLCEIGLNGCTAKEEAPVTAVWTKPGRTQTNVCPYCLTVKMEEGEWTTKANTLSMRIQEKLPIIIDLSTENMVEVTLETLSRTYNIPDDGYINEEGNLVTWYRRYDSGHIEVIRKATEDDKEYFRVVEKITNKYGRS